MGNREITLGRRIIQTIFEIIIGIILLTLISFIIIYFLYKNRIINSYTIKKEIDYNFVQNENNISNYLNNLKVNYVIFYNDGKIKNKYISDLYLTTAQKCFENKKSLNTNHFEYLFFKNKNLSIIIKIPYIPEFTNIKLEDNYHFNTIFNTIFIIMCFIIFCHSIIKLIHQTKKELLELERIILENNYNTKPKVQTNIIEIKNSITKVKNMKKNLMNLIKKEKEQQKDMLFQISALSHDIRTPLTIIKGNAGLIEYCEDKTEIEECIKDINSSVESIENYIDQIILYTKLSYYSDEKSYVKINDLIKIISEETKGYKKDINFKIKCDNNDKYKNIFCSKTNVERALINIITNAFRYANTEVILSINFNKYVEFKIYNDGQHLDEELISNIGKLFFTGDKKRESNNHYGIGLYFAKNVAYKHKGYLNCKNLKNGVEFIFAISTI